MTSDRERPPSSQRGYNSTWRRVRAEALTQLGLPPAIWHLFDCDHVPRYNPRVEPDHRKYRFVVRPHGDHSRHTMGETHRGVRAAWRDALPPAGELFAEVDLVQPARFDLSEW